MQLFFVCGAKLLSIELAPFLEEQERLAVSSIARDDPSTLPSDDPFPRAPMHRDCKVA